MFRRLSTTVFLDKNMIFGVFLLYDVHSTSYSFCTEIEGKTFEVWLLKILIRKTKGLKNVCCERLHHYYTGAKMFHHSCTYHRLPFTVNYFDQHILQYIIKIVGGFFSNPLHNHFLLHRNNGLQKPIPS